MLLLFLLCRLYVCLLFRDSNMISISTAEFRYYVCYCNTSELWKTLSLSYKGLRQLRLSAFNELLSMKQVYGFHTWIFIARFLFFILPEFLNNSVMECMVNPIYLIGCCDYTLINLVLKTNIQFNPQDVANIRADWGAIIYDPRNRDLLTIHFSKSSSWQVLHVERYAPTTTFVLSLLFIFLFCFLYFVFDIYILLFLCSNKTWLSERFSFLSRSELLLLEKFLFYFNVFIFLHDYQF